MRFLTASVIRMASVACLFVTFSSDTFAVSSDTVGVSSPNGDVTAVFQIAEHDGRSSAVVYSVSYKGHPRITSSSLGVRLSDAGEIASEFKMQNLDRSSSDTKYSVFPGKTSEARDHFNEMAITLTGGDAAPVTLQVVARAYDDGFAFRYYFPGQENLKALELEEELSEFRVAANPKSYPMPLESFNTPYEWFYFPQQLEEIYGDTLIGLPLLMEYPDSSCMAITEAHLEDYAGMYLTPTTGTKGLLSSRLSPLPDNDKLKVKADLPHSTPWRVIMFGDKPGDLIESNLVNNLNPPSVITDTSWIEPGKTTFPWWNGFAVGDDVNFKPGLNTDTMKHYIDFCAEAGIEYHSLDGLKNVAWYGGPIKPYEGADITTTTLPDLDLNDVMAYAKQKGVKLRFWMNWRAAKQHMHKAFPLYEKWGIEGVMIDFIDRDDQEIVNFIHELVALAAKHKLTVTLHNCYKPTGLHRTYPNLMTYEAVYNLEYNKWRKKPVTPEHDMTVVFTRMLAGPLDYHSGGFRHVTLAEFEPHNVAPVVVGTRARELARYVVFEGYLPMMGDYPAAYRGEEGLDALVKMPTSWDETRVLAGEVGDYIVMVRRSGEKWYVGAMTDEEPRELTIPLKFLGNGEFSCQKFADSQDNDDPDSLDISRGTLKATDELKVKLKPAGGHMLILEPGGQRKN